MLGAVGAIGGAALDEDRLLDPMAGAGVGVQVRQQIVSDLRAGPEVVVGVDDPAVGVDDVLLDLGEPFGPAHPEALRSWPRVKHGESNGRNT